MMKIPMTVFGGLQFEIVVNEKTVGKFQYRWRYLEGYNRLFSSFWRPSSRVSIPMTVFGGLQSLPWSRRSRSSMRFNTDDGIWRATIIKQGFLFCPLHLFQYRWRYLEGYNKCKEGRACDFERFQYRWRYLEGYNLIEHMQLCYMVAVSIPMTVFGGLQFWCYLRFSWGWGAGFNTDDGIWRATINRGIYEFLSDRQFQYRWRYLEGYNTRSL